MTRYACDCHRQQQWKAIALRFGAEGANGVATAKRMALCEEIVAHIMKNGGEAWAIQSDVANDLVDASPE